MLRRTPWVRPPSDRPFTLGERLADKVATHGGSWSFILCFAAFLAVWAGLNVWALGAFAFDPYPFIFLNLLLSMLAAVQAPIIMMSQNRMAALDRQHAAEDREVNRRAQAEIEALHAKLDEMRREIAAMRVTPTEPVEQ